MKKLISLIGPMRPMRPVSLIGLIGLVSVLMFSCEEKKGEIRLPESKGQPAELLVVAPAKMLQGEFADTLNTVVDCDAPGLGSTERIFRTMTIGAKGFGDMYKMMHSQLILEIDPAQKKTVMGTAHDVYARPQLQVLVKGSNEEAIADYLSENRERIQRIFLDFQLDRYAQFLETKYSKKASDEMKRLGYDIRIPSDIASAKTGKDFLWASSNRGGDRDINFVFYTYPWNGESITDTALFVAKRDSVLKANIPGSQPNQWVTTTRGELGTPVLWSSNRNIAGKEQFEVRGLWEMKNGFMGGPFVSLVSIDSVARKVVVTESFVFSPNSSKRDLLRSVEAGLRTLRKKR